MAIILSDNLKINAPKPVDSRYINITTPWTGTTQVNATIPIGERYPGLTVDISGVEYWYQTSGDVTSGNLTIKDSGIASTGITTAINGLTKIGNAVRLGGTLTGSTVFTDSRVTPIGLQYGSDYSPNFTLTSLADWQSVATVRPTGQTVGFTLSLPMLGEAVVVTSATPVNVTIPTNASVAFPIGSIITIQQGGAGTVTAVGASGVTVNGVVLSTTKQYAFVQYWKTAVNTWSVIGGAVEIWQTSGSSLIVPVDSSKRVPIQFISGLTSALSGYVCTASNGINKVGQNVALGGSLTGNTTIGNNTSALSIKVATLNLTGSTAFNLSTNCGLITTSDNKGLEYSTDYSGSFANNSLITKKYVCSQTSGITSCAITTASNGLNKVGQNVALGGPLTGDTTIDGAGADSMKFNALNDFNVKSQTIKMTGTTGICLKQGSVSCIELLNAGAGTITEVGSTINLCAGTTCVKINTADAMAYLNDYSSCYKCLSIPNVGYVTGFTCNIACKADKNIASVGQIIYRNSTQITGDTDMIYCEACESIALLGGTASGFRSLAVGYQENATATNSWAIGRSSTASGADSAILGGCNNQTSAVCSAIIGGQINCICTGALRAAIIGGQNITLTGATYNDTVAVDCLAIMMTPTGSGDLLCWNSVSKKVGKTSLSAFGGITGATNGLTDCGSQRIGLGGTLCTDTCILGGGTQDLCLGMTASKLDSFIVNANCGCLVTGNLAICSSGATYTDLNAVTKQGIKYAGDYSLTYDIRSLVDKGYVDSVATGLNIHQAVCAATTVPINLATIGLGTIDGFATTTGNRILVKNQTLGQDNGIYSASTGTWGRTSDYQTNVQITNGDLIPVTSGSTQNSSIWALITPEPITVGVTPLDYTEFSTIVDVTAGPGIAITQVGGVHTVCVNLASPDSGLDTGSGLAVGQGHGILVTGGTVNVNARSCGSVPAIYVGYNANGDGELVVANADILGVMVGTCALTGATNGLTATSGVVKLGGNLCETTSIDGVSSNGLHLSGLTTFNLGFGCGIVTDTGAGRGLEYAGEYSGSFVNDSLVSKYYVDNKITGGTVVFGATNGLCVCGTNATLGGELTGDTTIYSTNASIDLNINLVGSFNVTGDTTILCNSSGCFANGNNWIGIIANTGVAQAELVSICPSNGACTSYLIVGATSACGTTFTSSVANTQGILYGGVYRNDFVCNSLVDAAYVTGITSTKADCATTITGGTNGISIDGVNPQNLALGGTLCCPTTTIDLNGNIFIVCGIPANTFICLNDNSLASAFGLQTTGCAASTTLQAECYSLALLSGAGGAIFTDSTPSIPHGIVYNSASYRNTFIDTSLVDKGYVDTMVTGGTGISVANNGLTKTGNTVQLGGCLIHETIIQQCLNNFCIVHTDEFGPQEISFAMCATNNNIKFGAKDIGGHETIAVLDSSQFEMYSASAATFQGFTYCNGFNTAVGNKKSCSIPDLGYVTGLTSCAISIAPKAITGVTNGLTKFDCHNACLGGALTGPVTINGAQTLNINVSTLSLSGNTAFNLSTSCAQISTSNNKGLEYSTDYSTTFASNSLITKKYVCSQTSGITSCAITSACNGLTKSGQAVILGGPLTGNTCISGAYLLGVNVGNINLTGTTVSVGGAVKLTSTPATGASTDGFLVWNSSDKCVKQVNVGSIISASITGATNGLTKVGQRVVLGGTLSGGTTTINGGQTLNINQAVLNLTGSTSVNITSPAVTLQTTPPAGVPLVDAVLVWNSVDKQIKTVSGAALGDKNNIYAMTVVTSNTLLTTGDTYVQIVNSPSAVVTITLPASPNNGQVFRIKDAGNNAVNYNITVAASGGKVIDNGVGTASINTDGGALELVYNNSLGSWFVFSFVN
jgi:hypothetical protein